MESQIRKRQNADGANSDSDSASSDGEGGKKKKKKKPKRSHLQEELSKYSTLLGVHSKSKKSKSSAADERDVIRRMDLFRGMLKAQSQSQPPPPPQGGDVEDEPAGEDPIEVDTDTGFLSHSLSFPKDDGEETRKAERDYEVIDPRQRSARAKEEERERKGRERERGRGRGRR